MKAKKNKQCCTLGEIEKFWVAVDDISSKTASIIDVMTIVQKLIVEYKTLSDITKSVSQKFLLV